jgi:hypothetical protein
MLMPSTKGESKKDFAPARLFRGQNANGRADLLYTIQGEKEGPSPCS